MKFALPLLPLALSLLACAGAPTPKPAHPSDREVAAVAAITAEQPAMPCRKGCPFRAPSYTLDERHTSPVWPGEAEAPPEPATPIPPGDRFTNP